MKPSLLLPLAALFLTTSLHAQTYSGLEGLTSGEILNSYSTGGPDDIGGLQFLTGADASILESVAWSTNSFIGGQTLTLFLYSEGTSTNYGTLIDTLGSIAIPSGINTVTLDLADDVYLDPETKYWIGLAMTDGSGFVQVGRKTRHDGGNTSGILQDYTSELGWTATGSHNSGSAVSGPSYPAGINPVPYAFNITASVVPEPSGALLLTLTGTLALLRRRRV